MDWVEKYRDVLQQSGKSTNTVESYVSDINEFLQWFGNTYAKVKKALEEYLAIRPSSRSDKIFIGQRGPLRREAIDKIIKKYCRIAGIEEISAHVLRHTFCTRLVQEGTPIPVVSKLAGHSSIQTTMDFYVRVSRADKAAAVEKLT